MHSGERWRLGHRPGLDGLRGIAILLVLVSHFGYPGSQHFGGPGVTAFFVLSGFLITSLLLEERQHSRRISLSRFWMRRVRRLVPALVVCVGLVVVFATASGLNVGREPIWALTYTMDFVQSSAPVYVGEFFNHTWSLAVEEQFYLLWPLLLLACKSWRLRSLFALTVGLAALSFAGRMVLAAGDAPLTRLTFAPDVRAEAILIGCALGMARLMWRGPRIMTPLLAAAVVGLAVSDYLSVFTLGTTLAALCAAVLVWGVTGDRDRLTHPALRWLGARSYGLYLWHVPVIHFVALAMLTAPWWQHAIIAYPVAFALAATSWRWVEQPFLRRRSRETLDVELGHVRDSGRGLVTTRPLVAE